MVMRYVLGRSAHVSLKVSFYKFLGLIVCILLPLAGFAELVEPENHELMPNIPETLLFEYSEQCGCFVTAQYDDDTINLTERIVFSKYDLRGYDKFYSLDKQGKSLHRELVYDDKYGIVYMFYKTSSATEIGLVVISLVNKTSHDLGLISNLSNLYNAVSVYLGEGVFLFTGREGIVLDGTNSNGRKVFYLDTKNISQGLKTVGNLPRDVKRVAPHHYYLNPSNKTLNILGTTERFENSYVYNPEVIKCKIHVSSVNCSNTGYDMPSNFPYVFDSSVFISTTNTFFMTYTSNGSSHYFGLYSESEGYRKSDSISKDKYNFLIHDESIGPCANGNVVAFSENVPGVVKLAIKPDE